MKVEVDEDGNGFITLDEFISAMAVVPALQDAGDVFHRPRDSGAQKQFLGAQKFFSTRILRIVF